MDSKYEKMIHSTATELVEEIEADVLYAAFLAQQCPLDNWINNITLTMIEVFNDILQDMNRIKPTRPPNRETGTVHFWRSFAFWRKNNSGGY